MKKFSYSLLSIALITTLTGCFGGGGDDTTQSGVAIGQFVDSAVEGVEVFQDNQPLGKTNHLGQFTYVINGGDLTFKIGKVTLGSSPAKLYVTPEDLTDNVEQQTIIMQVLQSLDSDNNPENGITIAQAQFDSLANLKTEHDIDISKTKVDPADVIEHAGIDKNKVVNASKAREHFAKTKETVNQNLTKALEGYWRSNCIKQGDISSITFHKLTKAEGSYLNFEQVDYNYHTPDCSGAYDIKTKSGKESLEGEANINVVSNNLLTVEYEEHGHPMKEVYNRIPADLFNKALHAQPTHNPSGHSANNHGIYGTWRSVECQTNPDKPAEKGYVYRTIQPHNNEKIKTTLYASSSCDINSKTHQIEPEDIVSRSSVEEQGNRLIAQYEEHGHKVREEYVRVDKLP